MATETGSKANVILYSRRNDVFNMANTNGEKITADELDQAHNFFFFITGYPAELRQVMTK